MVNYYLGLAYTKSPKHRELAQEKFKNALDYTLLNLTGTGPLDQRKLTALAEEIKKMMKE